MVPDIRTASRTEHGASAITLAYHMRTKHRLDRYAAGPETLDWDAQPNPFREFAGCPRIPLVLGADRINTTFGQIYDASTTVPAELSIDSIGALLELSMGLAAWKEHGPDRWAVRCNPSSGNLHPTEAYVLSRGVAGLDDGLYHYVSRDHVLEQRYRSAKRGGAPGRLWLGLSSVHWREAWKYGERAFRYCQLDIGHALGAVRYAAGALGWAARVVDGIGDTELASLMGLDREEDFAGVERDDADLLIAIDADPVSHDFERANAAPVMWPADAGNWAGRANRLDAYPMYRWPIIDQVSQATHAIRASPPPPEPSAYPPLVHASASRAGAIIVNRRSAQRFDSKFNIGAEVFYRLLDSLLVRPVAPWDVWNYRPRLHPIIFVHRVDGLDPGLYALIRHPDAEAALRASLRRDFLWQRPDTAPGHLPFVKLASADCRAVARTVSCHQAIASDGCFSLGLLSEFGPIVAAEPWRYRQLHWEAGLLGHVLYLEAEATGLRGTGIGCYFDDAVHDLLGLTSEHFQSLYHFTVGRPLADARITTLPGYPDRQPHRIEEPSA